MMLSGWQLLVIHAGVVCLHGSCLASDGPPRCGMHPAQHQPAAELSVACMSFTIAPWRALCETVACTFTPYAES